MKQYERLRFSNPGGQFVHLSEQEVFGSLLAKSGAKEAILDIPCGTGRMLPILHSLGFNQVYAADYSDEMLQVSRSQSVALEANISQQDIYKTSFNSESFSVVLSSRFLFHCDDQARLFTEVNRLIAPGGYWVFDTLNWSPRRWTTLFSSSLGGQIYTNSHASVNDLAKRHGFTVLESSSILALPSFVYNFIPSLLLAPLKWLESCWPTAWKSKQVWLLKKTDE